MNAKTKIYLKKMGIVYLLAIAAFIIKICSNNRKNYFYTLTSDTLISGTYDIYDDNLNKVGKIKYEKSGDHLIFSISGDKIEIENDYTNEKYEYEELNYNRIEMTLEKYEDEFYYYSDTGESVLILCQLRPWFTSHSTLEKLSRKPNKYGIMKDRKTFMLINSDYRKYTYSLKNHNPTIQNHYTTLGGYGQLYRCFFIQEDEI